MKLQYVCFERSVKLEPEQESENVWRYVSPVTVESYVTQPRWVPCLRVSDGRFRMVQETLQREL